MVAVFTILNLNPRKVVCFAKSFRSYEWQNIDTGKLFLFGTKNNVPSSKMTNSCIYFFGILLLSSSDSILRGLCKVRMRTVDADGGRRMRIYDNYKKIRKIRNDRSFSSFNLRTIACNLYPCELVFLIQKWQVPKHLDLKGRLISGTSCKTNLGLRVLQRRPLATFLMPC